MTVDPEYMAVANDEDNGMYFDLDAAAEDVPEGVRLAANPEYEAGVATGDPGYAYAPSNDAATQEPMYDDAIGVSNALR